MLRTALALVGLLVVATPAGADWQYAKWGMTVDQVAAASKGQMKRCGAACEKEKTDSDTALLYTPYSSGEFEFTAFAYFNNQTRKLSFMSLRLDDPSKGYQLIGALKGKYGEPSSQSRTAISTMAVWRGSGDQVSVMLIGSGDDSLTTVTYQPRLTNSNKGL
jgi:hypothetical protein